MPGPDPRSDRNPQETVAEAAGWLARGMPFAAHEVYEDAWRSSAGAERELWRGLAQLMAARTHAERANPAGAAALLRRAEAALRPFSADPPFGLDIGGLIADARRAVSPPEP